MFSSIWLKRAFLRPQAAGEVAEVVDGQRNVGVERLADRLAVVHRLGIGEQLEVLLQAVGDLQQHVGALGGGGAAPLVGGGMGGVEGEFDVFGARARRPGVDGLPVIGVITSKYWPFTGGTNLPLMKLS